MKVERLDHIHIYVKDLEKAKDTFSRVLGTAFSPYLTVKDIQIRATLSPLGLELVESTSPDGVVAKAIQHGGEGLYALSFKVPDLEEAIKELQSMGMRLVGRVEVGNIKEAQFHPKDCNGVMIELCQYQEHSAAAVAVLVTDFGQRGEERV